ncbi:MAG TPA: hypothetical protein VL171_15970 [Verrucomicrobiae bacterium]|nr:hypothetical protein [Verrucomicrobiae bacterium]
MDKIFDRLLVEFLIPAFLMLLCLVLFVDVVMGNSFNLINPGDRGRLISEGYLLVPGLLFAYLLNTSVTAAAYLWLRKKLWGRVREYCLLRKLNVFQSGRFTGINCLGYIRLSESDRESLKADLESGAESLYTDFKRRMEEEAISARSVKELVDAYDTLRTIVMDSGESAITEWIQYHWAQLRLARGSIIPAFLLMFLVPIAVCQWGCSGFCFAAAGIVFPVFFLLQCVHYYYRERFMTYTMVGYFLRKSSRNAKAKHNV